MIPTPIVTSLLKKCLAIVVRRARLHSEFPVGEFDEFEMESFGAKNESDVRVKLIKK